MRYIVNLLSVTAQLIVISRILVWAPYILKKLQYKDAEKPNLNREVVGITGKPAAGIVVWCITVVGIVFALILRFFPQKVIGSPFEAADYKANYYVRISDDRDMESYDRCAARIHITSEEYEEDTDSGTRFKTNRLYYMIELKYPNGYVVDFDDYDIELSRKRARYISEIDKWVQLTDKQNGVLPDNFAPSDVTGDFIRNMQQSGIEEAARIFAESMGGATAMDYVSPAAIAEELERRRNAPRPMRPVSQNVGMGGSPDWANMSDEQFKRYDAAFNDAIMKGVRVRGV